MEVKLDCLHFNGYKPCKPHKEHGVHCEECNYYSQTVDNILIIKLRAAGEVIRNTPILWPIKKKYPKAKIFWLTDYPDFIPKEQVYKVLRPTPENIMLLKDIEFEVIYSLDKDLDACAWANGISSKEKKGFSQRDGVIIPFDEDAKRKWLTGVFDDLMKQNLKHYVEEIFEICGFDFKEEPYILPKFSKPILPLGKSGKKVIALNTGAGEMWKPRLYSKENWTMLAAKLLDSNYEVLLVGGPAEDEKNQEIAKLSGAKYFGTFSFSDFIGVLSYADAVVTSVTLAFHVAVGLGKKIVLLNNTFNKAEFYMYGEGGVLEPDLSCTMCYKNDFDDNCQVRNCMDLVTPTAIEQEVSKLLSEDSFTNLAK